MTPERGPLLPCPFCGNADIDPEYALNGDGTKSPGCWAEDEHGTRGCGAIAESNEKWNTRAAAEVARPIDMILFCPACGHQHVDAPDPMHFMPGTSEEWTNPPHRSHLCHECGHTWRPADVATNGVRAIKTKGKLDSPEVARLAVDAESIDSSGPGRTGQAVAEIVQFGTGRAALKEVSWKGGKLPPVGTKLGVIATPLDAVSGGACRPSWGAIEPDQP